MTLNADFNFATFTLNARFEETGFGGTTSWQAEVSGWIEWGPVADLNVEAASLFEIYVKPKRFDDDALETVTVGYPLIITKKGGILDSLLS